MNWDEKAKDYAGGQWRPDGGAVSAVANLAIQDGARWQREALLSDEAVERVADILEALDGDDYLTVARVALTAAIGDDGE